MRQGVRGRPASCSRIGPSLAAVDMTARTPARAGRRSIRFYTDSSPARCSRLGGRPEDVERVFRGMDVTKPHRPMVTL